jgi:hypothetical protein
VLAVEAVLKDVLVSVNETRQIIRLAESGVQRLGKLELGAHYYRSAQREQQMLTY